MTKPWRLDVDSNTVYTVRPEWLSPRLGEPEAPCIVERANGSVWKVIPMTPETLAAFGRDCIAVAGQRA